MFVLRTFVAINKLRINYNLVKYFSKWENFLYLSNLLSYNLYLILIEYAILKLHVFF